MVNKDELKSNGFDIIMSINKKQAEIQSLQQQLNEIMGELQNGKQNE